MLGISGIAWRARTRDMLYRLGIDKGEKPRVADEIMPSEVRPPSAPAAAKRPTRKRAAAKKK